MVNVMLLILHVFYIDYHACFHFETWGEGSLLHILCDVPCAYQMECVRNCIHPFENVPNFVPIVRNLKYLCPKIFVQKLNI